ncbi:hypothetical protein J4467_02730 [Candidatus Woesearchaeota archaeon]|nr:hypothetical protein [Candidatus Woesearchaeota archaeon]
MITWEEIITKVEQLDLETRVISSSRTFDEIPIWMPSAYGGFGDIMTTLKLGEGLKREFPDKKVTVYFGKETDYKQVQTVYPHFNPKEKTAQLNGISVAQVSDAEMRKIMGRSVIGIYSPVGIHRNPPKEFIENFLMEAAINLYIQEYDAADKIYYPQTEIPNRLYRDKSGRQHVMLATGFDEDSVGIHIDPTLTELSTGTSYNDKTHLLQRAGFQIVQKYVPNVLNTTWGFAYHNEDYTVKDLEDTIIKALEETKMGAITIFNFNRTNSKLVKEYAKKSQFRHVLLGEEEGVINNDINDSAVPNIHVVHVGYQPHDIFLNFLRYSELPVLITGDASLSEAVSLRKIWIYQSPPWKVAIFPNFVKRACGMLDDWREADRITSLFGCRRVTEKNVHEFPEVEKFYITYRKQIHQAFDLEKECRERKDNKTEMFQLFGKILREQGFEQADRLEKYFREHNLALWTASFRKSKGIDAELRTLRKTQIFGPLGGHTANTQTHRLFFDPEYQASFRQYTEAIIRDMDISKNLANLIRKAIQQYQEHAQT